MALTTHPHEAPRLKKEYSSTLRYLYSPLQAFVACSRGELYFTFTLTESIEMKRSPDGCSQIPQNRNFILRSSVMEQSNVCNTEVYIITSCHRTECTYSQLPLKRSHCRFPRATPRGTQLHSSQPMMGSNPYVYSMHSLHFSPVTRGGQMQSPVLKISDSYH